jgi:hypothetical protein
MAATRESVKSKCSLCKNDFSYFARGETFSQGTCSYETGNTLSAKETIAGVLLSKKLIFAVRLEPVDSVSATRMAASGIHAS